MRGQTVLDLCAAPGSKTSQIVEMLDGTGAGGTGPRGGVVVANDNDAVRAPHMRPAHLASACPQIIPPTAPPPFSHLSPRPLAFLL